MLGALIRLAISVVQSVVRGIMQQNGILDSQVIQPTRAISDLVKGGSIWRGNGANAFTAEVDSLVLPALQQISTAITTTNTNIERATTIIQQADSQVQRMVNSLADRFKAIY